jgi:hypothetical protein
MSALGTPQQARARSSQRIPALHIVVAVVIAVLLLFLWMHFLLAMQIEATGRQIQEERVTLERLERQNAALARRIAESSSQDFLKRRAEDMGYELRAPHYLPLARPLLQPANGNLESRNLQPANSGGTDRGSHNALPLLDIVAAAFSAH